MIVFRFDYPPDHEVGVDGGGCQVFQADPLDYVEKLYGLRQQYRNLHGV